MKALTWQGLNRVEITEVPDPVIEQPTDAVVRVTSTAICGSDLHLYGVLAPLPWSRFCVVSHWANRPRSHIQQ